MRNIVRSWKHKEKARNIKQYGKRFTTKYDSDFMNISNIDLNDDGKEEEI